MMQNPRVFLWIGLALVLWLNYEAWLKDYAPKSSGATAAGTQNVAPVPALKDTVPEAYSPASGQQAPAQATAAAGPSAEGTSEDAGKIRVRTDVLDLDISTQGGTFVRADLLRYPKVKGGSEPVRLMNSDPAKLYLLETGLTGPAGEATPTHLASFTSDRTEYQLGGAEELRVPLVWTNGNGVEVTKTFVFRRGQYRIDVEYQVANHAAAAWQAAPYARIVRNDPPTKRSMFDVESYAFHGPALYDGKKYSKLDIKDEDDRNLPNPVTNGWAAALQHHFVSAVVPPRTSHIDTRWRPTAVTTSSPPPRR